MSLPRKPLSLIVPPKTAVASHTRRMPVVPPVYRPQPVPKVLQTKQAHSNPNHVQPRIITPRCVAPPLAHTQRPHAAAPPRVNIVQAKPTNNRVLQAAPVVIPQVVHRTAMRGFTPRVVQATKFYPNLHPGAAVPVDRSNIFSLDSFANQYRLHRAGTHSINVPNMKYNFVRTREGQTLLHNRYRHPSLAEGQQVLYAGEVFFNNGNLEWWSNGSGHYQPDADGAEQANLPMDYFYSYQQVIKGEHLRKRG